MSRESNFLIYCMERYRYFKGLSGAEAAHGLADVGVGDLYIVQDIDDYISTLADSNKRTMTEEAHQNGTV